MKTLNALSRWTLHLIGGVQLVAAIVFICLDPTCQSPAPSHYPSTQARFVQADKDSNSTVFQSVTVLSCPGGILRNDSLPAPLHLLATCPEAMPTNPVFGESTGGQRAKGPRFTPEPVGHNH